MASVCLVTNYNYGAYISDCLVSLENQRQPFDRVIVVDDGSTDDSAELARQICRRHPCWSTIGKENGGQLSCLNFIISEIDPADIVYFIDADDIYPADYLSVAQNYIDVGTDFLFGEPVPFKDGIESPISTSRLGDGDPIDIPMSSAITRLGRAWVGSPTSALAIRGRILKQILPYSFEADWVTRADDVLIYGSSIVGARKRYVQSLGVAYRLHAKNNFFGNSTFLAKDNQIRNFKIERLFNFMCQRAGVRYLPSLHDAFSELKSIAPSLHKRFFIPDRFHLAFGGLLEYRHIWRN